MPLPMNEPSPKQILVDVGDGPRVGVDARVAPVQPGEPRAVRAGQADAHPGLQNPVPIGTSSLPLLLAGGIKRARFSGCAIGR